VAVRPTMHEQNRIAVLGPIHEDLDPNPAVTSHAHAGTVPLDAAHTPHRPFPVRQQRNPTENKRFLTGRNVA
jgi:hypothetical protein